MSEIGDLYRYCIILSHDLEQKAMDINEKVQPFKGSLVHEFTGLWLHGFKNASFLSISHFKKEKTVRRSMPIPETVAPQNVINVAQGYRFVNSDGCESVPGGA